MGWTSLKATGANLLQEKSVFKDELVKTIRASPVFSVESDEITMEKVIHLQQTKRRRAGAAVPVQTSQLQHILPLLSELSQKLVLPIECGYKAFKNK